ncbi:MAG TPA: alpha/beta hydrolase [Dehalococcoidia bacterium]|nr:alpha/beta hydrolase [Dehalococcoidia bacterium]
MATHPIRSAYGPAPQHFGDLRLPGGAGQHPVVMLIHGGFWRSHRTLDLMQPIAEDLAARGVASWNVEYRRVANADLGTPADPGAGWPGTLQDLAAAADHLRILAGSEPLDLRRVAVVGHSAGGHLALWLAARPKIAGGSVEVAEGTALFGPDPLPIRAAVSLAGVNDLAESHRRNLGAGAVAGFLGGSPAEVPDRYALASPAELLPLGVPQVLVHGDEDEHVPIAISRIYTAAARGVGDPDIRLHEFPGLDHFAVIDPRSEAWAITVGELVGLLG